MAEYPIYRLVKGDQLTFTEMDNNLRWLSQNMSGSELTLTGSTISMTGSVIIDGDVFINGTASIGFLKTIAFSSGSNQLGNDTLDVQTLIGTVNISGSLNVSGSTYIPDLTGSLFGTASWARNSLTASYVLNAVSASYAPNIYNTDGNLTSDRTMTIGNFTMSFSDGIYLNGMYVGNRKGGDYDEYATIVGKDAALNSDALEITAIGLEALNAGGGDSDTAIGAYAMRNSSGGGDNTAVGAGALESVTNGSNLTAIGVSAGGSMTDNDLSVFVGSRAGLGVTGTGNIIIEPKGLYGPYLGIGTGQYNTVIGGGISGLPSATSNNIIISDGQGNIKYRWDTIQNNIVGNLAVTGSITATQNITASNALITGTITAQTLHVQTITSSVIYSSGSNIFGNQLTNTQVFTGSVRITGSLNVKDIPQGNYINVLLLDTASGDIYTTSSLSISTKNAESSSYPIDVSFGAPGESSLFSFSTVDPGGEYNIAFGVNALSGSAISINSIALGRNAGLNVQENSFNNDQNIFIGFDAGREIYGNTNDLIAIGPYRAGYQSYGVNEAILIGKSAGEVLKDSSFSIFLGSDAGYFSETSSFVVSIGNESGRYSKNVQNSIFLGSNAGGRATNARNSIFLGESVGYEGLGENNIIIGKYISLEYGRKDSINIGGLIFATGSYNQSINPEVFSGSVGNGKVGINVVNPQYNLEVSGSGKYSDGLTITGSLKIKDVAQGNYINVLLLDTASGQVYVTASTALSAASVIAVTGDTNLYSLFPKASVPGASSENSIYIGSGSGTGIADYNSINSVIIGFEAGGGTSNSDAQNSTWIGYQAGYNADYAERSILIGYQAGASDGQNGPELNDAVFLGYQAGYSASFAYASNFLGYRAGMYAEDASNSNFLGNYAGYSASDASDSNFLGSNSGFAASLADDSNFLGSSAGAYSRYAEYSNFFGFRAGFQAYSASYSTLIGYKAGDNDTIFQGIGSNNIIIGTNITLQEGRKDSINIGGILFGTGSFADPGAMFASSDPVLDGKIGINKSIPTYNLDVSGSGNFTKGLDVTGSLKAPDITGSLFGTSSWARNSVTSSNFNGTGSNGFVSNMGDTYTGTAKITDIVTLNQTEYNAIGSPSTNTLYIIL